MCVVVLLLFLLSAVGVGGLVEAEQVQKNRANMVRRLCKLDCLSNCVHTLTCNTRSNNIAKQSLCFIVLVFVL